MVVQNDIYGYDQKIKNLLERIKSSEISRHNKRKILEFYNYCIAAGLSKARILRYLYDLFKVATWIRKNFKDVTRKDIQNFLQKLEESKYSPRTKLDFKKALKKFYKWLNGGEEYPECVKWVKTGSVHKLPDDTLTEEEVKRMVEASSHPRDRALIITLYESGCRVGELLSIQIKHVSFENPVTKIMVSGKTRMRRIPLIDSTSYLAEWINSHPLRKNRNAPLWVGIGTVGRNKPLDYAAVRKLLREAAKRAGIEKNVNPHNFRHSRATHLAKSLTEAQLDQMFGWVQGSRVASTYVHLSGRDLDDAILKLRGLKEEELEERSPLAPKRCQRCGLLNKATGKFCSRCGAVLDIRTAVELQDLTEVVDKGFAQLIKEGKLDPTIIEEAIEAKIREVVDERMRALRSG